MTAPYYTGNNVPLKFKIEDAQGAVEPTSVKVRIACNNSIITLQEADADVESTTPFTVSYIVPTNLTTLEGDYEAFFDCDIPGVGIRTHVKTFKVVHNP